jgi:hypothetical protein
MVTTVAQTYTAALNVSVTTKNGVLVGVTQWVSGDSFLKTERVGTPEYVARAPRVRKPVAVKPGFDSHEARIAWVRANGDDLAEKGIGAILNLKRAANAVNEVVGLVDGVDAVNFVRNERGLPLLGSRPVRPL